MVLVKSLLIKGSTDFGKVKADLEDVAVRTRKVGEMSPTIKLGVDDGAATLKLAAFRQELRSLKDAGSQSGLTDLAARLKAFGNETGTARTKMAALKLESDALKASMGGGSGGKAGLAGAAGDAQGAFAALAGGGGGGGGGMAGLIAAGVALSPVMVTVGTGLGGLAIAAAGVIGPVLKASQSAGGLQKAWAKLDPLQRQAAGSLITLKADYHAFQSSLKPEILTGFSRAVQIGGNVLHAIQPVAAATGKAFDQFLGQFGATLRDPEWTQFWAFMARTAPGDMRLLGNTFIDLVKVLPPLIQDMQPVAKAILITGDDAAKAAGGVVKFYDAFQRDVPISTQHTIGAAKQLDQWVVSITNHLGPWARAINNSGTAAQHALTGAGAAAGGAVGKMRPLPALEQHIAAQMQSWATQQATLNTALAKGLTPLQNYIGATLTQRNDLKNLSDVLKLSGDRIGYNTQNQRNSFGAAQTYIADTLATATAAVAAHKGIDTQITSIQNALPVLERVKGKTKDYRDELAKLRNMLDILRAEKAIGETIRITGLGDWSLSGAPGHLLPHHRPTGHARGTRGAAPGWALTGEEGPELVYMRGGETVLSHPQTARALRGYAGGTIDSSYRGAPGGLRPWALSDWDATIRGITRDIGNAMARQFMAGGGFPGGRGSLGTAERAWMAAGGPGGLLAHIAGAIAGAESGWTMAIQAGQPYATTGWGPWQITPGNSEPQAGTDYALLNWRSNALAAVAKYRQAGGSFAPWTTFTSGAYLGFMDHGGWLRPGWNLAYNGLGRPEPVGTAAGTTINLTVNVPPTANPRETARQIAGILNQGATAGIKLRTSILGPG